MARPIARRWRILEMEMWDRESIDLIGPAFIEFTSDGSGSFRFIAVRGYVDGRHVERTVARLSSSPGMAPTKGDQVSGRGWAELQDDGSLRGHFFIHAGDDSGFSCRSRRVRVMRG